MPALLGCATTYDLDFSSLSSRLRIGFAGSPIRPSAPRSTVARYARQPANALSQTARLITRQPAEKTRGNSRRTVPRNPGLELTE
jgi:hypothetical protein